MTYAYRPYAFGVPIWHVYDGFVRRYLNDTLTTDFHRLPSRRVVIKHPKRIAPYGQILPHLERCSQRQCHGNSDSSAASRLDQICEISLYFPAYQGI